MMRLTDPRRREEGIALVMVLGIMLVGAIILATLAAVTMYNANRTVQTRTEARAQASADAGIDLMLSMLAGKKYNQLNTVCTQNFTINSDLVQVATEYTVTRAGSTITVACPLSTDITTALTVYSTSTTNSILPKGEPVNSTVVATFMPTPPETLLDKAIFSEGSTIITNNTQIQGSEPSVNDAHIYSNGGVDCRTQVNAGGSIYAAQGNVILNDNCKIGNTVWASGTITMKSQSLVDGDAYAASSAANWGITLDNSSAKITGNALTNGGIQLVGARLSDNGGIGGSAFARTGPIRMAQGATISGSAYGFGSIRLEDGARVYRDAFSTNADLQRQNSGTISGNARARTTIDSGLTVSGTRTPNVTTNWPNPPNPAAVFPPAVGYPTNIQAPPREQMPKVTMGADDIAKWVGMGWTVETYNNQCTGNGPATRINTGTWAGPRLIIFTGCSSPVSFENANISLKGNLALVSNTGFQTQNNNWFRSDDTSQKRDLYMIVPADAPGVSWNAAANGQTTPACSPQRNINFNTGVGFDEVRTMLYTPCQVNWSNGTHGGSDKFIGQVYGGQVNISTAITLQMSSIPIPSLGGGTASATDDVEMNNTSRFDLLG